MIFQVVLGFFEGPKTTFTKDQHVKAFSFCEGHISGSSKKECLSVYVFKRVSAAGELPKIKKLNIHGFKNGAGATLILFHAGRRVAAYKKRVLHGDSSTSKCI
jgi:hypothetical protein